MTSAPYPSSEVPSICEVGPGDRAHIIDCTAAEMGVRVLDRALSSGLMGLTLRDSTVVLSTALTPGERTATLAHELGHVLVNRGHFSPRSAADEESYADAFARHLLGQKGT